jgi:hypothetical protein
MVENTISGEAAVLATTSHRACSATRKPLSILAPAIAILDAPSIIIPNLTSGGIVKSGHLPPRSVNRNVSDNVSIIISRRLNQHPSGGLSENRGGQRGIEECFKKH